MANLTVKKKLEMMQQIRSRNQKNKYDMFHREKILYGRTSPIRYGADDVYEEGEAERFSTFSLRLLLAAAAFALLVLSDRTGAGILGLTARECFAAISRDYESSIAAWADDISQSAANYGTDGEKSDDRPLKDNPPAGNRP